MQIPPENRPLQPLLILVERLDTCWERYLAELKRTRRDFANEYVHDLRVAIRRLIAIIEMGRAVVHLKELKRTRHKLKTELDAFDALRDTQVQLTIVEELQDEIPVIAPFRDYLRKREKRLISSFRKEIKDFQSAGLAREVARLRKALLNTDLPDADSAIWSAIDEAYSIVIQRKHAVRRDDMVTVHRLRLAFKHFRYMVESIYPLLPDPPADLLRRLHEYHAQMGEIQDLEVSLQMFAEFAAKSGSELPAVLARLQEMHQARVQAFLDDMQQVETFWRSTPLRKFAWQQRKRPKSLTARESS